MLYYCISKAKIVCSEHQGQRQSHRYTPSPNGKYVCIHRISKYIYSITSLWNSPVGIGDPGRLKASAGFLFFCFLRFFCLSVPFIFPKVHVTQVTSKYIEKGTACVKEMLPDSSLLQSPMKMLATASPGPGKCPGPTVPWLCFGPEVLQRMLEGQQMGDTSKTTSLGSENGPHN